MASVVARTAVGRSAAVLHSGDGSKPPVGNAKEKLAQLQANQPVLQSFEDMEGLIVNMGVVSALIMSFAVATTLAIDRSLLDRADMLDLAYRYESFRDYLDPTGSRRVSLGIPDDLTPAACMDDSESCSRGGNLCFVGGSNLPWVDGTTVSDISQRLDVSNVAKIRQFVEGADVVRMRMWLDLHSEELGGILDTAMPPGTRAFGWGVIGVILDLLVLVNSLGLYMSLTWLDVRETAAVSPATRTTRRAGLVLNALSTNAASFAVAVAQHHS